MRTSRDRQSNRHRSAQFTAVLLIVAVVSVGAAATAAASTVNTRSDHAALSAYNAYLGSLLARVPIGTSRDQGLIESVDSVKSGCRGYLAPYAKRISRSAGYALGVEIGGDLALKFTSAAAKPLHRLASRLGRLPWSEPRTITAIGRFSTAENALVTFRTSALCADVIDLGSHPRYVGPGTRRFEKRFKRIAENASQALQGFLAVLKKYQAKGDSHLFSSISRRAGSYQNSYNSVVNGPDKKQLITDLGLSLS